MTAPRKLWLPMALWLFPLLVVAIGGAIYLGNRTRGGNSETTQPSPIGGLECGQWAVFRTCEIAGIPISPAYLQKAMPAGTRGHSLQDIADMLKRAGLAVTGKKESFDTFLGKEGLRVVHMTSPDHFIVVLRAHADKCIFLDYQGRRQVLPSAALRDHWSGNILYIGRPQDSTPLGFDLGDPSKSEPRIQFETLFIDKGDLPTTSASKSVDFEFRFHNLGKADLRITKVRTSCTCLAAKKPDQPIAPGKSGSILLRYSIDQNSPSFHHDAVVETNDPVYSQIILRAAGTTNVLVTISPTALRLGTVPYGSRQRALVYVRYNGEEGFTVKSVTADNSGLELAVHAKPTSELTDHLWPGSAGRANFERRARVLEVTLPTTWRQLGEFKREIVIETDVSGFEKMKVSVTGLVVPPVEAVPSLLNFGETTPAEPIERTVRLVASTGKPVRVISVNPKIPDVEWSVSPVGTAAEVATLRFSTTGGAAHKLSGTKLSVKVDCGGKEFDLELPVFAAKKVGP